MVAQSLRDLPRSLPEGRRRGGRIGLSIPILRRGCDVVARGRATLGRSLGTRAEEGKDRERGGGAGREEKSDLAGSRELPEILPEALGSTR